MLRQDINLYYDTHEGTINSDFLPWRQYKIITLLLILFFVLLTLFAFYQLHNLREEKVALQKRIQNLEKTYQQLKQSYPGFFFSDNVTDSLKSLQAQLETQKELLSIFANRSSFSKTLIALGQTIVNEVWLKKISILSNGNKIVLQGYSSSAKHMQNYIMKLENENAFKHFNITLKHIDQNDPDQTQPYSFEINLIKKSSI